MLTDSDKVDIFSFAADVQSAVSKGDMSRIDLAGGCICRTLRFVISHPDMCAAEFDDFLMDRDYALREVDRLFEKNAESK